MTVKQALFLLLKSEISDSTPQINWNVKPDGETLKKLYKMSKSHDVAHIAADALEKAGFLDEGEASAKFKKKRLLAMYRTEQIKHDLESIKTALEESGVDFLPLKGSVIRELYPMEWMRTSCDIDVLVKKEDCDLACKVLCEKCSFTMKNGRTLHDCQLLSPSGVLLELHYTLIEDDCLPKAAKYLEKVWEESGLCEGKKHEYKMSGELFMLYHAAHTAKHVVHGGCGIKSFVDLYILERKMPFDREKLEEMLRGASLLTFYKTCVRICDIWFENGQHDETTKAFESYVISGGVYGTASNEAAMSAGKGESRVKSFLSDAFLSYDALCVIYPALKGHKWQYPFYQAKRWFRVFDKNKRKKILDLTTIRNNVSDEKQTDAKRLLDSLEIE